MITGVFDTVVINASASSGARMLNGLKKYA